MIPRALSPALLSLALSLAACSSSIDDAHHTGVGQGGSGGAGSGGAGGGGVHPPACEGDLCDSPLRIVRISENNPRCFVRASGKAVCIGGPFEGEPGEDDGLPHEQANVETAVAASGMLEQMCFLLASGEVMCRGGSHHGQLGLAVPIGGSSATPLLLPEVTGVVQLSSGHHHVCGRTGGGQVMCWGGPYSPSLGVPGVQQTQAPLIVPDLSDVVQIASSVESVCALRASGEVLCWGWLPFGSPIETPTVIQGIEGVVTIGNDWGIPCALLSTGKAVCFQGVTPNVIEVDVGPDVAQLVSFDHRACARRIGGEVVCWKTGEAKGNDELAPVGLNDAIDIAVGPDELCALTASGKVLCMIGDEPPHEVLGLYP